MSHRLTLGCACACLAFVAGCSSLLPKQAALPTLLTLEGSGRAVVPAQSPASAGTLTLIVDVPRAAAGYDSALMAYQRGTPQLEYFAQHQWVDTPAHMLTPVLVRALQQGGAFRAVVQSPTSASGEWRLQTEGLRLRQDFSVSPSVMRIELRAVLVETATRKVLATREFMSSTDAASDDPVSGARAAADGAKGLASEVAAWCGQRSINAP